MAESQKYTHALPRKFERVLAALALYYQRTGSVDLHRLAVNARYEINEAVDRDNYDGTVFHDVHLLLPPALFAEVSLDLDVIGQRLKEDANRMKNCPGEVMSNVFLELNEGNLSGWRENSGVLMAQSAAPALLSEDDLKRIWDPGFLRVFISHKAECKEEATSLKLGMSHYGLSGFVAHCDIKPAREWQDEIERALQSMHVMVLLLTKDYHDSDWTDQETGVAIGRGVPILPVRIDIDPYGFVGKLQAVSGTGKGSRVLAKELLDLLLNNALVIGALTAALVTRFEESRDFDQAKELIKIIGEFKSLPQALIDRLEKAPEVNQTVGRSFAVERVLPALLRRLKGAPTNGKEAT